MRPEDCDEFPRAGGNGIQKLTKPDLAKFTNNKLSLPSKHIFEESEDEAQEFEAQESEAGEFEAGESEASDGSEEDDFETPKALRTKKMVSSGELTHKLRPMLILKAPTRFRYCRKCGRVQRRTGRHQRKATHKEYQT